MNRFYLVGPVHGLPVSLLLRVEVAAAVVVLNGVRVRVGLGGLVVALKGRKGKAMSYLQSKKIKAHLSFGLKNQK